MQDERFPVTVYAELMRGLAAWLPPASIPGLPEVFEPGADGRPGPQVLREAAIESCLVYAAVRHEKNDGRSPPEESAWPQSIWRCERDESGRVRIVFGRWLAMMGQGASSPILENQLQDHDERVRQQALVSLGILGSARGREIILAEARRPNGRLRLAAIEALRHAGVNTVLEFAHDDSANVRSAVAEQLAAFPELKAALALQRMLTDRDPRVQKAAVEATTDWPRELAVPLLMYGIREGIYHTRLECTRRLHHYVDLKEFIDVEDPWAERSETLLAIARRHGLKLGLLADLQRDGLHGNVNAGMHEEVRTLLRDVVDNQEHPASRNVAVRRLERMADGNEAAREEIVPVIESFLSKKEMPPGSGRDIDASTRVLSREEADGVETVYRQILPAYDAGYAAAAQLSDAESAAQVRAARELADLSAHSSLSPALIRRIRTEIRPDAGDTVFQYLLKAIENNGSDEAAQLARLALGHYSPRIRKTACRYFERHGSPRHGLWLLGALNDRDLSVQLAAIRAAGRCGHPGVLVGRPAVVEKDADGRFRETTSRQLGLRDLRHDLNHQVRFETAVAMSFLGDPEGMQQMMRYTSSPDVRVRRTAVQEIGLTGRSWFVEPLIDLAWTELNHGDDVLEREILASLDRLVAPINRPKGLARSASIPERIRGWAAWRESQAPPGDAPGSASDNPSGGVQRASQETENSTNEAAEK
jgi:HEAT repeat protein